MRVVAAPVKAPFSWPNSSLSSSSAGSAAQFTFTNGLLLARRALVDGARDQLLADAALAADQHGDVAVGDLLDDERDLAHRRAVAPADERLALIVAELPAQVGELVDQAAALDRLLDRRVERDLAEPFRDRPA